MKKAALIIVVILILIFIGFYLYTWGLKISYPDTYAEYIDKYSEKYNIEKAWIFAIIKAESNFDKTSVSKSGAKGLMQIMDETGSEMAKEIRNKRI